MAKKLKFVLVRVENIEVKGEKCWFPTMFSRGFSDGVVKRLDCVVKSQMISFRSVKTIAKMTICNCNFSPSVSHWQIFNFRNKH